MVRLMTTFGVSSYHRERSVKKEVAARMYRQAERPYGGMLVDLTTPRGRLNLSNQRERGPLSSTRCKNLRELSCGYRPVKIILFTVPGLITVGFFVGGPVGAIVGGIIGAITGLLEH